MNPLFFILLLAVAGSNQKLHKNSFNIGAEYRIHQKQHPSHLDSLTFAQLKKRGGLASRKKDTVTLKLVVDELKKRFEQTNDSLVLANYYFQKAKYYRILYQKDSAFFYYRQSKNISSILGDSLAAGRRLLTIGILEKQALDLIGSEISYTQALRYLEPIKAYRYIESAYTGLGLICSQLGQFEDAKSNFDKALSVNQHITNTHYRERGYLFLQSNIGIMHQRNKNHKKALRFFQQGLAMDSIAQKHSSIYPMLLQNVTISKFYLDYPVKEVLEGYNSVVNIYKKQNNLRSLSTTYLNIARCKIMLQKETKEGIQYIYKALELAQKTNFNKRALEAFAYLAQYTSGETAKEYMGKYLKLNDSILKKERLTKNQFARVKYNTEKQEKENQALKAENTFKQQEILRHKQQKLIGWLAAVIGFLGVGVSILVFLNRKRKLVFQAQLQKAQAREQERQQIAKSLHDEVAGDLRVLHRKLEKSALVQEAQRLDTVKENVRNLSHQLSSVSFTKVTFKEQVVNLVTDYFDPDFKIIIRGIHECDWSTIDAAIKRLLYLCMRESIQNSKKHAQASQITITLAIVKKNVHLTITDNGVGFDTEIQKNGIGLQNLQERVEELHGNFVIQSTVNQGTQTNVEIPINV